MFAKAPLSLQIFIDKSYLMGKGLCAKIKKGYKPFAGQIELSLIDNTAKQIIENVNNKERLIFIHGHWMEASLVSELINYGMH